MDSQNLRTFLMLSKLKSFTGTAEKLFVAQSTVTNRIAELEKETGKKLFTRDKRRIQLTKEGVLFQSFAKRILELEESAIQEINRTDFYKNTLRIGSANSIYECHLYSIIHSFLTSHKDISIKVILNHSQNLIEMLEDQMLDGVFSYLFYEKTGYSCIHFATDELILVTSPENKAFKKGIYKRELLEIDYLMCDLALQEAGQFIRTLFPSYYQFPFEIDNSIKLIQYLIDGMGYSFLPKSIVNSYIEKEELGYIPLMDFDAPLINSYFIYRNNDNEIKKFLELLKFYR
ncbi:LysR family transcriptional regulator [Clostridium thailandense]|uniref:LysR family transcriptional regulator n=1 Tax=Clostridium thailandense TaxID=2794346 RepID=UPI003989F935